MTYSEKLKHPKWQKKRLEILNRDNFTCVNCGDKETTLNVHHKKYTGEPYEAPNDDLETLCEDCHYAIDDINKIKDYENTKVLKITKKKIKIGFIITILKTDGLYELFVKKNGVEVFYISYDNLKLCVKTIEENGRKKK